MTDGVVIQVRVPQQALLTSNQRLHWADRARRTRWLRQLAAVGWVQAGRPRLGAAHCVVMVWYPDRRRRDHHNLMPTCKAVVDGLVGCGLLPDDSDRFLVGPDVRPGVGVSGGVGVFRFVFRFTPIG